MENDGKVYIPMIVDKESFQDEDLMMAGIRKSDIRKWRIGNRLVDVVLVPGTKEQLEYVLRSYSADFKTEDRSKRCTISGNNGKTIRCPETNKCSECPYYYSLGKKS